MGPVYLVRWVCLSYFAKWKFSGVDCKEGPGGLVDIYWRRLKILSASCYLSKSAIRKLRLLCIIFATFTFKWFKFSFHDIPLQFDSIPLQYFTKLCTKFHLIASSWAENYFDSWHLIKEDLHHQVSRFANLFFHFFPIPFLLHFHFF